MGKRVMPAGVALMGFGFPDVLDVPVKKFLYGRGTTKEECKRVVETVHRGSLWDNAEVHELADGAGAEDVSQKEDGRPEEPAKAAVRLGVGGVSLGLGLVYGGLGHEGV
jgi:hypothetical protein